MSSNIVNVIENEFNVTLQPAQPSAGEITFIVKNQGHIPHNFRIHSNGIDQRTSMIMSQQRANLTLQLDPGTYEYECTIEGHDMAGMRPPKKALKKNQSNYILLCPRFSVSETFFS